MGNFIISYRSYFGSFAVSSVEMAKAYYEEQDGILDEENPEDTSALDQTARDFLDGAIQDYSKKELIDAFINGINDVDDVMVEWHDYVVEMREQELVIIIEEERLRYVAYVKKYQKNFQKVA